MNPVAAVVSILLQLYIGSKGLSVNSQIDPVLLAHGRERPWASSELRKSESQEYLESWLFCSLGSPAGERA